MIGEMSSLNWDNMSTLYNMSDFHKQTFSNIQLVTFNFNDHHSSLELLSLLKLLVACLISSFIDWLEFDISFLHVLSTNIEIKCNTYIFICSIIHIIA